MTAPGTPREGWAERQIDQVTKEVNTWPAWLRREAGLNTPGEEKGSMYGVTNCGQCAVYEAEIARLIEQRRLAEGALSAARRVIAERRAQRLIITHTPDDPYMTSFAVLRDALAAVAPPEGEG